MAEGIYFKNIFRQERLTRVADGLAVALAVSLPWSTSATSILAVLLLIALVPTLDLAALRTELTTPAGGMPVLLWIFGLMGMLWANAPLAERIDGLSSFHKLLVIPLLIVQFRRSGRGFWVLAGFLISCSVLLVLSWALVLLPGLSWRGKGSDRGFNGIPVKDYISQGVMFAICIFVLAERALQLWRSGRLGAAVALDVLALGFVANVLLVVTSRTAYVELSVLLILFIALARFDWKRQVVLLAGASIFFTLCWLVSPHLRGNLTTLVDEIQTYSPDGVGTRASERLEYWRKSLYFLESAPIIGHGTGSIPEQFRRAAVGQSGVVAELSTNPHNQTLAVAIQLGLLGVVLLWSMWASHLWLFRGIGLAAYVGLAFVVQNLVGSLFNSHLFDFTHGWLYVVGVGVAGGMVRRNDCDGKEDLIFGFRWHSAGDGLKSETK
jgi:O-antigen ligase